MNNFLKKYLLTIKGAGGGGAPTPPPPVITQYPAVLAPPQYGQLNTIMSFSYAEMIDLLSDGPIEGLVNKDGQKIYDENIFEGIYLNDSPVKETSSVNKMSVNITFLKNALKQHFSTNKFLRSGSGNQAVTSLTPSNFTQDIDGNSYNADVWSDFNYYAPGEVLSVNSNTYTNYSIKITSYHPDDSIVAFLLSRNLSLDSSSLIQKAFDLSPIINEKPFLTKINIPKFKVKLLKSIFDRSEGSDGSSPLKISIPNISNYLYFTITNDNLTSFNYFEMPRSFVENITKTSVGKSSFNKSLVSENDLVDGAAVFTYEIYDLNIYIWSIYSSETGVKDVTEILDKYLTNINIYQNNASLYNYNLIQSEFKNGSEIQSPLNYFKNVEIDFQYQESLVGPYKITNNFNPNTCSTYGVGGIQRLTSLSASSSACPPVNVPIEQETSDDVRYIKNWPVEYNSAGDPYIIKNAVVNYSQFDKTSTSRTSQDAVPITHYIGNQNVTGVYVTLNLQGLHEVVNQDLVSWSAGVSENKSQNSLPTPDGVGLMKELPGTYSFQKILTCNLYFLVYGTSAKMGRVIDASNTPSGAVANLFSLLDPQDPKKYFEQIDSTVWKTENLFKKNIDINQFVSCNSVKNTINFDPTTVATSTTTNPIYTYNSCLFNYNIYNGGNCYSVGFDIDNYASLDNFNLLESKLKTFTEDGTPYYCYNLNTANTILKTNYLVDCTNCVNSVPYFSGLLSGLAENIGEKSNFYISSVDYLAPDTGQFLFRKVVALDILPYINFTGIYENSAGSYVTDLNKTARIFNTNNYLPSFDVNKYPNIHKYLTQYVNSAIFKGNISQYIV